MLYLLRNLIRAKRLYNNHDFWYIIMLVNNIFTVADYNMAKVKYIPANRLSKMQTFVKYSKNITTIYEPHELIESYL